MLSGTAFLIGVLLWLYLTGLQKIVFQAHNDVADALYLSLQIGMVYVGMLFIAYVGTQLFTGRPRISPSDAGIVNVVWTQQKAWFCVGAVLLGIPLVIIFSSLWTALMVSAFHLTPFSRDTLITRYTTMPFSQTAMILLIVVLAPFCEETLFRGFVFRQLLKKCPVWVAVILSATLFALGHEDLVNAGFYFASGVVLALLCWRTESIVPGIVWHSLVNLLFVISALAK